MINKELIAKSMFMQIDFEKKQSVMGEVVEFFAIAMLPAIVTWDNGQSEKINLNKKRPVKFYNTLRKLAGEKMASQKIQGDIKKLVADAVDQFHRIVSEANEKKTLNGKRIKDLKIIFIDDRKQGEAGQSVVKN